MKAVVLALVVICIAGSSAVAESTVKGTVKFTGTPPVMAKIQMAADPNCKGHTSVPRSEEVLVGKEGGLKNVFVYVKKGLEGKTIPQKDQKVLLDQKGCVYSPHVVGIQTNQPLEISNSDPTLHNVNSQTKNNPSFNFAQPVQGMKTTKAFANPEIMISLICNVHPWMRSYVGVVAHPFFGVSDEAGHFEIKDLPDGTYTLEAWHEKYGTATTTVAIAQGAAKPVAFQFAAK
jgi:hypothetical protein